MASGSLKIKLEIANRDQFIKDLQAKIQSATSEALTSGLKDGWKKSADSMQSTLSREPLKLTFNEQKLQIDAVRIADQLREAAKFEVRVDFTEARTGYASFTEELSRYRSYSKEMDQKAKLSSLTRIEGLRKEQKKQFANAREVSKALLTSQSSEERVQARNMMESLSDMEKESTRSLYKLSSELDKTSDEFKDLQEDFEQTRSTAGKFWVSVKEKGKGVWDALHSRTASWIKGLAAAYISYSAVKTAIFGLIGLQDQLAEKTAATGVSYKKAWEYVEKSSEITLDYGESIEVVGDIAQYGSKVLDTFGPLIEHFSKLKVLGQDLGPMTEYFSAMAHSYGSDIVPVLKDFTNTMYNIENKVLRDKAMQTLVEQVQIMGTSGPKWLASASRGMVETTKALENMGVRTGIISEFMTAITEFNPFSDQGDVWSQTFKTYLTAQEEAKLAIGGETGYQMALVALQREAKNIGYLFEGSQEKVAIQMKMLMMQEGFDKNKVEMLAAIHRGDKGFEDKLRTQMGMPIDEKKVETEYKERAGTVARSLKGLKHQWESILMELGKEFLPVIKTFSDRLQKWVDSPEFGTFVSQVERLIEVMVDRAIPLGVGMAESIAKWLRTLDRWTGGGKQWDKEGNPILDEEGNQKTKPSLIRGAAKLGLGYVGYRGLKAGYKGIQGIRSLFAGKGAEKVTTEAAKKVVQKTAAEQTTKAAAKQAAKAAAEYATKAAARQAAATATTVTTGGAAAMLLGMGALAVGGAAAGAYGEQKSKGVLAGAQTRTPGFAPGMFAPGAMDRLKESGTIADDSSGDEARAKAQAAFARFFGFNKKADKIAVSVASGTSTIMKAAAETVTKSVEDDLPGLRDAVKTSAGELQDSVREMYNGKVWDTIREAFDETVVSKLPSFGSAVANSSASLFMLIQDTFGEIFGKGHEELNRLRFATEGYSSGAGDTPSSSATTTPGIALHTNLNQQFASSEQVTVGGDRTISPAITMAPSSSTQPISAISPELSLSDEIQTGTPEERLLARAVLYLGGIFANTQQQTGSLQNLARSESYQRMLQHIEHDLENLGALS